MRKENLQRFFDYKKTTTDNAYYLVYEPLIFELEKTIKTFAKGKLLDIGCGNKPYEQMFSGKIEEYVGCDLVQSSANRVDIICEATNIPLPNAEFDTVFSTQTLEHIADHQKLLSEAYRILKPGGHLILSAPQYWHLHEEPYDFFRFTKYGLEYLLQKVKFQVIEVIPNGGAWSTVGQSLIHALSTSDHKPRSFWLLKVVKFLLNSKYAYRFINFLFGWLDKMDFNSINTMNYVVVGRKQ